MPNQLTLEEVEALHKTEGLTPIPDNPEKQSYLGHKEELKAVGHENTLDDVPDPPDLDSEKLIFGKYKGSTPNEVADIDPGWLSWAYKNVTNRPTCSAELAAWCDKQPAKPRR